MIASRLGSDVCITFALGDSDIWWLCVGLTVVKVVIGNSMEELEEKLAQQVRGGGDQG